MKKYIKIIKLLSVFILSVFTISVFPFSVNAAPAKPVLKNDPMNGQILPFYEVWLRWYDVSNEHHYTMTVRDLGENGTLGDAGPLIYDRQYVAQNSTYFVIPTSKLARGHHYRWCLNSVDANGNRTIADAHIFVIEQYNPDRHFLINSSTGAQIVPMKSTMEYFVSVSTLSYDAIFQQAAVNWNGIANVNLVRTATPSDGHYEIGIYEGWCADKTKYGSTITGWNSSNQVVYSEIQIYNDNIISEYPKNSSQYYIKNINDYILANAMHEVGHALLLQHTTYDDTYWIPYNISKTISSCGQQLVPIIMNVGQYLGPSLNVVDRDHLRIKWGV